jgi:hypothetical protein
LHCAVWLENVAESTQPSIGIFEMMQHPSANDLVKAHAQFTYSFNSKLVYLEIFEVVLFLEPLSMTDTGGTAIDGSDSGSRPT